MRMAAIASCVAKRTTSVANMIVFRGNRSAITPPISKNTSRGTDPAASTIPIAAFEPVISSTAKAIAIQKIPSPTTETVWPV